MEDYKLARLNDYNADITKRWYVEYAFRNPETKHFEPQRLYVSSRLKSRTARYVEAKKIINNINQKLRTGFSPHDHVRAQRTLIEALNEIVQIKNVTCGLRAKHTYTYVANKFISWLHENKSAAIKPMELNKRMAMQYFDSLLLNEKLTNRTYNNNLVALRTLFNCMVERDYLDFNILDKIKKLPQGEGKITTYTNTEKETIKTQLPLLHKELYLAAMFVYYCFIRPAELVRLQFKDVFIEKGMIIIPANKSKNKRTQPVIMPIFLRDLWREMEYDKQPGELYIFSNNFKLTPGNYEVAPTRIAEAWKRTVQDKLGINKGIYLLKHTGVGLLFEGGADARNIQLQIRHHSLDETQVYLNKFGNSPSNRINDFFAEF